MQRHEPIDPAGVIFDLDGTLIDTLDDINAAINATFHEFGYDALTRERTRALIGEGLGVLLRRASGEEDADRLTALVGRYRELYRTRMLDQTRLYPGVADVLDALVTAGVPMCVLSNKPDEFTVPICRALLGRWHFARVRGATTDPLRKPDPTVALEFARLMNRRPDTVYFVGDSDIDIQTAHNAGMIAVGVTWGFRDRDELEASEPAFLLDHPEDVTTLVRVSQ